MATNNTTSTNWQTLLSSTRSNPPVNASHVINHLPSLVQTLNIYINNNHNSGTTVIKNTRNALRFLLSCFHPQLPPNEISLLQDAIVSQSLHIRLSQCCYSGSGSNIDKQHQQQQQESRDTKCQLLACRLLNNTIVTNPDTSQRVLIDLSSSSSSSSVWSLMIVTCCNQGNRQAVGALAGCLYNAIVAWETNSRSVNDDDDEEENDRWQLNSLITKMAHNKLLICNLLRQIVPPSMGIRELGGDKTTNDRHDNDYDDDVSEWIALLLSKISSFDDTIIHLFQSTGTTNNNATTTTTLERVVLLYTLEHEIDRDNSSLTIINDNNGLSSLSFLAEDCASLLQSSCHNNNNNKNKDDVLSFHGESHARLMAATSSLNIIARYLSSSEYDDNNNCKRRTHLGTKTILLSSTVICLGHYVDILMMRQSKQQQSHSTSQSSSTRNDASLSPIEQRLLTSMVRLIGNMCYHSKVNQDALREIAVPSSSSSEQQHQRRRRGLHVLLTCTSFSFDCFGLRERAIVAIRHALDGNEENMKVVEELEALRVAEGGGGSFGGVDCEYRNGRVRVMEDKGEQQRR